MGKLCPSPDEREFACEILRGNGSCQSGPTSPIQIGMEWILLATDGEGNSGAIAVVFCVAAEADGAGDIEHLVYVCVCVLWNHLADNTTKNV